MTTLWELESLLGPEDSEVDLRQILRYARRKKGGRIFEIFSPKGQSERLSAMGRAAKADGETGGRIKKEGGRS